MKLIKKEGKWSVTHNDVTITFEDGKYFETLNISNISDEAADNVNYIIAITNQIAEWLIDNHYEIIFNFQKSIGYVIGQKIQAKAKELGITNTDLHKKGIASPFTMRKIIAGDVVETGTLFRVLDYLDLTLQVKNKGE